MRILFGKKNRLHQAFLSGGVTYTNRQAQGNESGSANRALVAFDDQGVAQRIVLDGNVQTRRQGTSKKQSTLRSLAANHLALNLAAPHAGHQRLHSAEAKGHAILTSESKISGKTLQKTTVAAQTLTASFGPSGDLRQVNGSGDTRLETRAADGGIDSSSGDTLHVLFKRPGVAAGHGKTPWKQKNAAEATIRSAVQTGHVVLRQKAAPARGGGAGSDSTATAERADYTAADDTLTLTGHPRFQNARIELSANRLAFDRASGKATATGSVQTTLLPVPGTRRADFAPRGLLSGSEPIHLIADRAVLWRNTRQAVFSGDARLWRGADAIQAPQIELSGNMRILKANGERNCRNCVVATLAEQPTASSSGRRENAEKSYPSVFRILSQSLLYSDAERKASFQGQVQVVAADGKLTADRVDFFLANSRSISAANAPKHGSAAVSAMPAGVQKFVASGDVRLLQPGRTATGNRLIYTAANRRFTLTGDTASPPEIADASQGTVTGQKLTFDAQRQAIMVTGAPGRRTAAHTRVRTP
jgi:lipopolysaccharide export system protein LptA